MVWLVLPLFLNTGIQVSGGKELSFSGIFDVPPPSWAFLHSFDIAFSPLPHRTVSKLNFSQSPRKVAMDSASPFLPVFFWHFGTDLGISTNHLSFNWIPRFNPIPGEVKTICLVALPSRTCLTLADGYSVPDPKFFPLLALVLTTLRSTIFPRAALEPFLNMSGRVYLVGCCTSFFSLLLRYPKTRPPFR